MENKEGAAASAAQENSKVEAAPAECFFRKTTVAEDATFVEKTKEQLKSFTEAPMEQHWSCLKNTVRNMFADAPAIFGGAGNDTTTKAAPTSVESQ